MKNNNIDITIQEKEDFYNKFDKNKLSDELGTYIYNQANLYPLKNKLSISINTTFDLTSDEKKQIKELICNYFSLNINETINYYKYNSIKKFILFIVGIIFIFISHFWEISNEYLMSEVLLIVGWVAIWEVFDNILLIETKKNFKLKQFKKIVKSKIIFKGE